MSLAASSDRSVDSSPRAPTRSNARDCQRNRLAWLFRGRQSDARPHPLLHPVACLRGDCAAAFTQPLAVPDPVLSLPPLPRPRAALDREGLLKQVAALPALPQTLADAQRVLRNEECSARACVEVLGRDPALVAQVLRLANAASFGHAGRVASLHDAVLKLGRQKLGMVMTATAVIDRFNAAACPGFDLMAFWREAMACAMAAQALAVELGTDDDLAFTAGLLHDLGRLVLAVHLPTIAAQALTLARLHDLPLHVIERDLLGIDHAELGALVARHWGFPSVMVSAIAGHHGAGQPSAPGSPPSLTELLQGADAIVHALDLHQAEDERVPTLSPLLASRLQLTAERCARVLAVTEQGVAAVCKELSGG
jgi:putative nucleotidyltransferase with HDIG domain